MNKYENRVIVGLFLIIMGTFLKWHDFMEYYRAYGPSGIGEVSQRVTGTVAGYDLIAGKVIFALSLILVVLIFLPKPALYHKRLLSAEFFLTSVITGLFVIGGLIPVFTPTQNIGPGIGLVVLFAGCIITLVYLKKDLNS
ncbi:hypothetical protein Metev_0980 [Methanohalobium evestigatum Z-7303]|uniref:Uncharacterized protein n=1 Tax=Methanohalobium evestigatum (strain ATCC BAA-1072 / DSM 3721 / NBRC 107634 / OCM 161 / Z-7303) TaxID=644295 RepID=D7E7C2_METEZ|nr:hypothetical protein [Methanohalobium evestigatum]ADI73871.1 hypothetical protein Metev_0980 [Methanohalobium evestigatum Z-7303]